jgi:hypothetical protein
MIGKKKLSTIKAELREAFKAEGLDNAWFSRQIRKLERYSKPSATEIETLLMFRDKLAAAVPAGKPKQTRRSRVRSSTELRTGRSRQS